MAPDEFIEVWNSCSSVREFSEKTGMKRRSATTRSTQLRSRGLSLKKMGFPDRHGDGNSRWNGGRRTRKDGYVVCYVPGHPYAYRDFVLEHRLVMESHLGRYLKPEEIVHHMNENRSDNRIENLELTNKPDHSRMHSTGKHNCMFVPRATKEQVENLYIEKALVLRECARLIGISYGSLRRHMIEFGIPFKSKGYGKKRSR